MQYPRVVITDRAGKTALSCGLDILPLDTQTVRMKIREIYKDNRICSTRHKAVEQMLREEFLLYCSENGMIHGPKPFSELPESLQRLFHNTQGYDQIRLSYDE